MKQINIKQITMLLLLFAPILIVGCTTSDGKVVAPSQEEIKQLEEIKEYSEKTIIKSVELDLSDPLIAKCKEELDKCKQSLIDRNSDFTFEILEMKKFEPAQGDYGVQESYLQANEFYGAHKGWSQGSIDGYLQSYNLRHKTELNLYNIFPLVIAASKRFVRPEVLEKMGRKGPPNELPIAFICYKEGILLEGYKEELGC